MEILSLSYWTSTLRALDAAKKRRRCEFRRTLCRALSKEAIVERICSASVLAGAVNTTFFATKRNNEELDMPALCLHHITNTFESHSPLSLRQT
jgi:hypothetical protein